MFLHRDILGEIEVSGGLSDEDKELLKESAKISGEKSEAKNKGNDAIKKIEEKINDTQDPKKKRNLIALLVKVRRYEGVNLSGPFENLDPDDVKLLKDLKEKKEISAKLEKANKKNIDDLDFKSKSESKR